MCTRYPIINKVSELKVHIELTRFVQPEKIEIDANERAVNEKSQYCFFVCTTFDSFLNDLSSTRAPGIISFWCQLLIRYFIIFIYCKTKFCCVKATARICLSIWIVKLVYRHIDSIFIPKYQTSVFLIWVISPWKACFCFFQNRNYIFGFYINPISHIIS